VVRIDYDDSIHNHHFDAVRVLVRIVKSGAIGNRLGVEEDKIGGVALDDCAAVREANGSGCAASHLVDGLWEANKIEIPGVVSKNPRKRSIKSGVRLALPCYAVRRDTWTIRADCDERVGENHSHILLRHRTHEYSGGATICNDQVTGNVERILSALGR
jgi:hypothetical protein